MISSMRRRGSSLVRTFGVKSTDKMFEAFKVMDVGGNGEVTLDDFIATAHTAFGNEQMVGKDSSSVDAAALPESAPGKKTTMFI